MLPENLDYKIIMGFEWSPTVSIVIIDKDKFEETGSEIESAIFSVEVYNNKGNTEVRVTEGDQEDNIEIRQRFNEEKMLIGYQTISKD